MLLTLTFGKLLSHQFRVEGDYFMNKTWTLTALSLAASIAAISTAGANTVNGTIWETTTGIAQSAVPANVPPSMTPGTKGVTFSAPSDPLSFNPSDGSATYTLATWLASAGATGISFFGGAAGTDSLDSTIMNIVGKVSVTTGETFSVSHDDGVTLDIGGVTVINDPGPTSVIDSTATYTGATGNQAFQLVYGECCGPPATLVVNLPLSSVPELSTWGMMAVGFGGIGFLAYRRGRPAKTLVLSA
jgi:hypothetical protein